MKSTARWLPLVVVIALVAGCRSGPPVRGDQMYELGADLTKLSAAVEASVRYDDLPADLADDSVVARATAHDPGLAAPFAAYMLRVARADRHAVVLVCTKDGRTGLLEDAGCSGPLEKHLWQAAPPLPCEFTVRAREVCDVK